MTQKLLTPPPELVKKIRSDALCGSNGQHDYELRMIHAAYAAGADMELEACCLLLDDGEHAASYGCHNGTSLRAARRPKPPTLNSIALQMLGTIERDAHYIPEITDTIRRALEALND